MVMRIKRYEAEERDLPKIIRQIRRELGENAVVKTRRFKKGGVMGIGGKAMVEVFAGVERDLEAEAKDMAENPPIPSRELLEQLLPKTPENTGPLSGNGFLRSNSKNDTNPVIFNIFRRVDYSNIRGNVNVITQKTIVL